MASPIIYPTIEDKDLDDAALWAVIDSATASHSSNKSKSLALRSPNFQSPNIKPSHSPQTNLTKAPRTSYCTVSTASGVSSDGEVVHEPWVYRPPRKVARNCPSEVSENSPLAVVRNVQRTPPVVKVHHSSPEEYLSPEIGKFSVNEVSNCSGVSPRSFGWSQEKDIVKQTSVGRLPSVSFFKGYQNSAMEILDKTDYTMISGNPFIKKSGWRKLSCYFNVSYEIRDKHIEFDESRNVQRAEFIVRAHMQSGRFSDGWGSCDRREKRFSKANHDIPSTAETRAKNKACQDLLGIGEYRPGGSQAMRS